MTQSLNCGIWPQAVHLSLVDFYLAFFFKPRAQIIQEQGYDFLCFSEASRSLS